MSGEDALERDLRELLARLDPVPDAALDAGRAAFAWRTVDEDLARLAHDSLLEDEAPLAGVRGEGGPRTLTFERAEVLVEMEVAGSREEERRIVGQLVPASVAQVTLEYRGGTGGDRTEADELGRFAFGPMPGGHARLRIRLPDGVDVRTEWVRL